ncbi:MAG TPA: hypothetical protein VIV12_11085, partial [Streptosporangiaceae bacterium]
VTSWLAGRDRQKKLGRNGNGIGTPLAIAIRLLPTPLAIAIRLLPTPLASDALGAQPHLGGRRPSGTKRQTGLPDVIIHHLARLQRDTCPARAPARPERLLPTPNTGTSPHGHGRRGGRPGNGHQSGNDLDAVPKTLNVKGPRTGAGQGAVAWGAYEPAIRRWEHVLGHPAPPPAVPGPSGRPRLSAAFAEWMMGIPHLVTGVPGLPRTAQLRIIGNGYGKGSRVSQ